MSHLTAQAELLRTQSVSSQKRSLLADSLSVSQYAKNMSEADEQIQVVHKQRPTYCLQKGIPQIFVYLKSDVYTGKSS